MCGSELQLYLLLLRKKRSIAESKTASILDHASRIAVCDLTKLLICDGSGGPFKSTNNRFSTLIGPSQVCCSKSVQLAVYSFLYIISVHNNYYRHMVATAAAQAQRRSTKAIKAQSDETIESPGFFVHQRGGLTHWVFSGAGFSPSLVG